MFDRKLRPRCLLVNEYGYGHTNTKVDLKKLDPVLVKAFNLDDPTILDEPKTHPRRCQPRRQQYLKAWDEVKSRVIGLR